MKRLQHFCATALLTLFLTIPVLPGTIHTGYAPPPPPPPQEQQADDPSNDEAEINGTVVPEGDSTDTDKITEIALSIVQSLLSIF